MLKNFLIILFLIFSILNSEEIYEIKHIKNFPYTGGPHTGGPDAIGGIAIANGYFYAADHDPISGYGGLWKVDECGNNPGFTDIDNNRDGPIFNVFIGKKYLYTNGILPFISYRLGSYMYDKNGQKVVSKFFIKPYEIQNFVLDTDGNIYDISDIKDIKSIDTIPVVGIKDIQGNSLYADNSEGPGNLVYIQSNDKIYLFSVDLNGLKYQDDIDIGSNALMYSDKDDNLYVYDNGTIFHYKVANNSLNLIKKGQFPQNIDPKQFIVTTIGGDKQAILFNSATWGEGGTVRWYDISDFSNIKHRTNFNVTAIKIAVKNNLIFRAYHYGIDIYLMKGKPLSQELYIKDNKGDWVKNDVTKSIEKKSDTVEFEVKIDNKNEKQNKDHNEIIPILKAPASDENFDIRYFVKNKDITSLITSSKGYESKPIAFNDSLFLKIVVKPKRSGVYKKEIEIKSTIVPKSKCGIPIGSKSEASIKAIVEKHQTYVFKAVESNNCLGYDWGSKIKSKIANKNFNIQVLVQTEDTKEIPNDVLEITKVDLVDCKDESKILKELWRGNVKTKSGCAVIRNLNYDKANRCANIKVYASDESKESKKYKMKIKREYFLSDTFSIRPKEFFIEIPDLNKKDFYIGEKFNIRLHALDEKGDDTKGYDGTIDDLDFIVKEQKKNCYTGKIIVKSKEKRFKDGVLDLEVIYDEIGEVKFELKEKRGFEFAKIDSEDKNRFILPYETPNILKINPKSFDVNIKLLGKDDNNTVVYYAPKEDIADMGAEYGFEVVVKNKNYIAKNFTKGCYSEDLNITTFFTTITSEKKLMDLYVVRKISNKILDHKIYEPQTDFSFFVKLSKDDFFEGRASNSVSFNFDRKANKAIEPLDFIVKSVKVTSSDTHISTIKENLAQKVRFYYLRLTAPSFQTTSDLNSTTDIFSEIYCKDCEHLRFVKNFSAGNDVYWYRKNVTNTNIADIESDISTTTDNQIAKKEKISFNKVYIEPKKEQIPLTTKVLYKPSYSWLLYDRYDPNVKEHSFIVKFISRGRWVGKGVLGKTVEIGEIPDIENQSIDW